MSIINISYREMNHEYCVHEFRMLFHKFSSFIFTIQNDSNLFVHLLLFFVKIIWKLSVKLCKNEIRNFLSDQVTYFYIRYLLRFFDCLADPKLSATFATDHKSFSYLLSKFSRVPLTIVLILLFSTIVNGNLLNFGKRYEDDIRVIFDQWQK